MRVQLDLLYVDNAEAQQSPSFQFQKQIVPKVLALDLYFMPHHIVQKEQFQICSMNDIVS